MHAPQTNAYFSVLAPISVAGGGTATTTEVDSLGYNGLTFIIQSGLVGANGVPTVKVAAGNTAGGTYTDISNAALTALVDADDNKVYAIHIINPGRYGRYYSLVLTNGATNPSLMSSLCLAYRADVTQTRATRGLAEEVILTA